MKSVKKCTPTQIMLYQNALQLHKVVNNIFIKCTSEHAKVLLNIVCTSRQVTFEIIQDNNVKIGMNITLKKFYPINKLISLNNLNFVHFKKSMKFQFLKKCNM